MIYPQHVVDYEGSDIMISCTSDDPVIWTKNDGRIDVRHKIHKWSLILRSVTVNDSGIYYCHGTYNMSRKLFKDSVTVHIGGK